MKNDTRQPLAAPYRADRATAASGIVVRMAVDNLRQKAAAAAHGMSVYVPYRGVGEGAHGPLARASRIRLPDVGPGLRMGDKLP